MRSECTLSRADDPNNAIRTTFLSNLVTEAHKLNPTRPVSSALNTAHIQGENAILNDPFANVLDVVGINEYIG